MQYDDVLTEKKIRGKSLEDCRNQLNSLYGRDFRIVDKTVEFEAKGLFKLRKEPVTVVTYVENHRYSQENVSRKDEEAEMEKNRQALLITTQMNQFTQKLDELKSDLSNQIASNKNSGQTKHETISKIEELLIQNEFSAEYRKMIEEKITSEFSLDQLNNFELVERKVVDWIGESVSISKDKVFRPPRVVIIVGPTGVGKTTTLVKLAAQFYLDFKKENGRKPEICFIMTDFMRVGAMAQLERYGELMEYSVLKAEISEDLKTLYDENREDKDAIFIDTSGCSPNDAAHLATMKLLLDVPAMHPDVYLAVTASTKSRDLEKIFQNYEPFGYNSIIITKCDETEQYGNVLSVLSEKHKSVSYITNGQNVTNDIVKANVIDFLIRLENFNIDREHIENKFGVK